jgi:hypothetical protein
LSAAAPPCNADHAVAGNRRCRAPDVPSIRSRKENNTLTSSPDRVSRGVLALTLVVSVLACTHAPPRTEAQKKADQEIETQVDNALQADTLLYAKHINVHSYNGAVRLSGYVWESPDLLEAQRIAEGVKGVRSVENDLELQRNGLGDSPLAR